LDKEYPSLSKQKGLFRMKKTLLLFLAFCTLFITPVRASWIFIDKKDNAIELTWTEEEESNLQGEESVFMKAFLEAYQAFTPQMLGIQDKYTFLQAAFADVRDDFLNKNGHFVSARKDGKVIGFVQFKETEVEHEIYIAQLAVDPDFWENGIGRELVYSIFKKRPQTNHLVVIPRRINDLARKFYAKLGFTVCSYMHPGYDPKKYIGYEWSRPEKAGSSTKPPAQ
jgi:ribosomal protein S18 acetylase RimI-like enzyme